jgi:uncharacterized protein with PIN domain
MILELDGLRNDNEKSLIFNILLRKIYLYLQNQGFSSKMEHLTIIEEAHRLLSYERKTLSAHNHSVKMKAQESFGDILAEIRTYGEAFIIVEQKPSELIGSLITNTNLKICHKLPSSLQLEGFKDSLGLLPDHLPFINKLTPGECILKLDQLDMPFFIQIPLVKEKDWGIKNNYTDAMLRENSENNPTLEDLIFIIKSQNNSILLEITELIYREKGVEKTIKNPQKDDFLRFPTFQHILGTKLKRAFVMFKLCPACQYLKPKVKDNRCPECNTRLESIEEILFPPLQMVMNRAVIKRCLELNRLLARHAVLAPSSFSRSSQRDLLSIKTNFQELIDSLE